MDGQWSKRLFEIAHSIEDHVEYINQNDFGLMGGLSGMMLFLFYYGDYSGCSRYKDKAYGLLKSISASINSLDIVPTNYSDGLAGTLAVLMHLSKIGYIDNSEIDYSEEIDEYIFLEATQAIEKLEDDFLYGAGGLFYYLLIRYEQFHPASTRFYLEKLIKLFHERIFCKKQTFRDEESINQLDLGMPHGYSSWMVMLSMACEQGILSFSCMEILDFLYEYYMPFIYGMPKKSDGCRFPGVILKHKEIPKHSRLGWCYGDLPCSIALLRYARIKSDGQLVEKMKRNMESLFLRRDMELNRIFDACLCHGTSGLGLLFDFIGKEYGLKNSIECAEFWMDKTEEMVFDNCCSAGYKKRCWIDGKIDYIDEYGLLNGISGIGLSIMACKSEKHNRWRELLLII